jgi:D-glycero-alpha-D-manno-heptose-7-phosphate kinase
MGGCRYDEEKEQTSEICKLIIGRAPVRISFSGGGTDLSSYYEKFGGRVVSATIDRYFYLHVDGRFDGMVQMTSSDYRSNLVFKSGNPPSPRPPFEIALSTIRMLSVNGGGMDMFMGSQVPPGSGLGSSGAVAVNMVNVLASMSGKVLSRYEVAEKAYEVGHDLLGLPIGKQDEYAAAFGGLNEFTFTHNKVEVRPIKVHSDTLQRLERNLMLFYLGQTREASEILKDQDSRTREGDPVTLDALHRSKELATETRKAIEKGDVEELGRLLHLSWEEKKKYTDRVTNPRIESIYRAAINSGALGGKLTGAGGSGHLLLCCHEESQRKVEENLAGFGARRVLFRLEPEGASVREVGFGANC